MMTRESKIPEFFSPHVRTARRFYLDLVPPETATLAVLCGGYERCAPEYVIQRESFPYWSIEFVARGKGSLVLAGESAPFRPGHSLPMVPAYRSTSRRRSPIRWKSTSSISPDRALGSFSKSMG